LSGTPDQRVLGEILGNANIAHHAHQSGNELGGLNSPDSVDGAMGIGRHRYPSHHLRLNGASRA